MAPSETAIAREGASELLIERSRFLGLALPARTEEEALGAIARVRGQHPQATHHCSAWRLGPGQERQSDDGEPQGTAGVPLLETLRRRGVDYGLLIVVRYYGGRKLGRPGLLRAYLGAGAAALDAAGLELRRFGTRYGVGVAHQERIPLLRAIEAVGGEVLSVAYAARVRVEFWLPEEIPLRELAGRCDAAGRAEPLGAEVRGRALA